MITLRLVKEYLTDTPIFCPDVDKMGHVSLEYLKISQELRLDISNWNIEYQSTFNDDYPPDSGFENSAAERAHTERGAELAEKLQAELGDNYLIEYTA